jgi:hypothetical protein
MMNRLLDWVFPIRREALAEADELMETYGDQAYFVARQLAHDALASRNHRRHRLLTRAKLHIAKRTHHPIGLDTATALLESDVRGLVAPKDATLH